MMHNTKMEVDNSTESNYDEICNWGAILKKFRQLTRQSVVNEVFQLGKNVEMNNYTDVTSLLYVAETDDFVEFKEGKPDLLIKYVLILSVGSSKSIEDPIGHVTLSETGHCDFDKCNFYLDYFWVNPTRISEITCTEHTCHLEQQLEIKTWCSTCHGTYYSSKNLGYIMHPMVRFSKIPKDSILCITKLVEKVDNTNPESLLKVKIFLEKDKKKIDIIQARINDSDERLRKYMEELAIERKYNIEKISYLLSTRGGSMDAYMQTIKEYNNKVSTVIY